MLLLSPTNSSSRERRSYKAVIKVSVCCCCSCVNSFQAGRLICGKLIVPQDKPFWKPVFEKSISFWIMRSTLSSRVSFPCLLKLIRTLYFVFPIRLVTVQAPGLLDSWFLIIMQLLRYMIDGCFDWDRDAVPLPVSGQHSIQAIMCSLIAS